MRAGNDYTFVPGIVTPDPAAFDEVASAYDENFSKTGLGRILRRRVWRRLEQNFAPGDEVLELACGTGEDAVRLAGLGVQITATDGSSEMVRIVQEKARHAGLDGRIETRVASLQSIADGASWLSGRSFDGAFSNFGGINALDRRSGLARGLAALVRPGGRVVLVPMGPFCPWEIAWFLVHSRPKEAARRLGSRASARVGRNRIPVWYPSAGRLARDFSPWFRQISVESLGLWLPTTNLSHLLLQLPNLWVLLSGFEAATARLTGGAGDHYMMVLERVNE